MIDRSEEKEFYFAAEALVDAALLTRGLRFGGFGLSAESRRALIEAIYQDPSLTSQIFNCDLSGFFHC